MTPASPAVVRADGAALADLGRFARRALRLDPGGSIRFVAHGDVLAVYACALFGGGGPTVLGLRTLAAEQPAMDITLPLESLRDRLARLQGQEGPGIELELLPGPGAGPAWAGMLPPRTGWSIEGVLEPAVLERVAAAGIAEVAAGTPPHAGAAAVAQLRGTVWGRDLAEGSQLPAGAAFAAEAYGFIGDEAVSVHRCGSWWRLSMKRGHVLARRSGPLS